MKKMYKVVLFIIIISILIAHLLGYKIYGSATLVKNHPLNNPTEVLDITEAGSVIIELGTEYNIYGITTILPNPLSQIGYFKSQNTTIEIETPENTTSKIWWKNRKFYVCGNTWFPQLLPLRLPAFSKDDLAQILIRYGGAIPDVLVFEESPEYAQQLMEALSHIVSDLKIEQNSEYAIRLGEYLIASQPKYFREGAWLLAHNEKDEIFNVVAKHANEMIDDFEQRKRPAEFFIGRKRREIIDFAYILMKLSENQAKSFLLSHIQSEIDVILRVRIATALLSVDDVRGYDFLMNEMMIDKTLRARLSHELDYILSNSSPGKYYPSYNPQKMYEWYQQNKNKLHWDKKKWHMDH